ncbi:nuclear transport factor 2 family protein [Lactococcus garvieae]|uniref:nuclear transport factor 2 family protein n=1 Tax=Lactococcus garvieae TaxID=1363 RepID=UPI003851C1CD
MKEKEKIILIYRQLNDWMVNKDTDKLKQLFIKEAYLMHMTGYKQNINEWLEQIDFEEMRYFSSIEEKIEILELNDKSATLLGKNQVNARVWWSEWSGGLQQIYYFIKINGNWKIKGSKASSY